MKAIRTRYIGATYQKPSRVSAIADGNNRIIIDWDNSLDTPEAHKKAAQALCNKMGWPQDIVGGELKGDYVWCFTSDLIEVVDTIIDWARTPGDHGGNPYSYNFVKLAQKIKNGPL